MHYIPVHKFIGINNCVLAVSHNDFSLKGSCKSAGNTAGTHVYLFVHTITAAPRRSASTRQTGLGTTGTTVINT